MRWNAGSASLVLLTHGRHKWLTDRTTEVIKCHWPEHIMQFAPSWCANFRGRLRRGSLKLTRSET